MDRDGILAQLREAEQRVIDGERHINAQERVVAKLDRGGHDPAVANALLVNLRQAQALHIADRDRLLRELSRKSPGSNMG